MTFYMPCVAGLCRCRIEHPWYSLPDLVLGSSVSTSWYSWHEEGGYCGLAQNGAAGKVSHPTAPPVRTAGILLAISPLLPPSRWPTDHDVRIRVTAVVMWCSTCRSPCAPPTGTQPDGRGAGPPPRSSPTSDAPASTSANRYGGTATVLVSPTTNRAGHQDCDRQVAVRGPHRHRRRDLHRVQAIATVGAVIGGGGHPARLACRAVLRRTETVPSTPETPKACLQSSPHPKGPGVPISTSRRTQTGYVESTPAQPVPRQRNDDDVAELSGGTAYDASPRRAKQDLRHLQQQIGTR